MYSVCLFCHHPLGRNDAVESLPVGRRLAFDPAKGRLWVVCRTCERWNLTPLEERWEAVEECERRFRGTKLRVSTENIGLARVPEGLELVRIGRPLRPEFAAWRYGDQLGRRRRWYIAASGAGALAISAAGVMLGALGPGVVAAVGMVGAGYVTHVNRGRRRGVAADQSRLVVRVPDATGRVVDVHEADLPHLTLQQHTDALGWSLRIAPHPLATGARARAVELTGDSARRAAAAALPAINQAGASGREVAEAVRVIESAASPTNLFAVIRGTGRWGWQPIAQLPLGLRVALEMASHEEMERRALEGELAVLEQAWRDAEAIARIADALLPPPDPRGILRRR